MAYCPNNIDRLLRDLEHTQSRKRWRKKLFSSARKGLQFHRHAGNNHENEQNFPVQVT